VKKLWGTFALTLVLFATLFSYEVNAAGTSSCTGAGGQSQLGQYCGSTESSQQGSDANSSLWKVWGGVSVVCIHACMAGGGGPAGTAACNVDTSAGSATQTVVSKNYSSGLTSIAETQGSSALTSKVTGGNDPNSSEDGSDSDKKTADAKAKKAKASACSGAIAAASKAMSNYQSMQSATQAAQQTTKAAASLGSNSIEGSGGATSQSTVTASRGNASICASARQTSSAAETLQCAVASDPTLPSIVTSGQLPVAFTKASGTAFSNFGSNPSQSPGDAIAQAAAGSLNTSDGLKVAALLKGMEGDLMANQGAMYASAGGGGSDNSDEAANAGAQAALQDQLKAMLAKSQGDQAQDQNSGISAVITANQNRAPAAVTEDKTLSIFDRVTYRYYFVVKQLRVENAP
jgi:hypothetical protein